MRSYIVCQGEADHLYTMYSNPTNCNPYILLSKNLRKYFELHETTQNGTHCIVSIPYNATMEEYQISFQSYPQHILKNH